MLFTTQRPQLAHQPKDCALLTPVPGTKHATAVVPTARPGLRPTCSTCRATGYHHPVAQYASASGAGYWCKAACAHEPRVQTLAVSSVPMMPPEIWATQYRKPFTREMCPCRAFHINLS